MSIHEGSRLRVWLRFQDENEETGELEAIPLGSLTAKSVEIHRPNRTTIDALELVVSDAAAGLAYVDIPAGVLDAVGTWTAQGIADGYRSDTVTWPVERNPARRT